MYCNDKNKMLHIRYNAKKIQVIADYFLFDNAERLDHKLGVMLDLYYTIFTDYCDLDFQIQGPDSCPGSLSGFQCTIAVVILPQFHAG